MVQEALAAGNTVPAEVLADYPDLESNSQPTPSPSQEGSQQPAAPTVAQLQARLNIVALALELEDEPAAVKQITARKNILELAIELA